MSTKQLDEKDKGQSRSDEWRILAVDDEEKMTRLVAAVLEGKGYEVRQASNGAEALTILKEFPANLVITDMVMPGIDGMALLAGVKERHPDTDVIMLTGFGTVTDAVEAMRRGAYNFLSKPFRQEDLVRLVEECFLAQKVRRNGAAILRSISLIELTRSLTRTMDIDALPYRAVELAREYFSTDCVTLLSYNPSDESVSVLAHSGAAMPPRPALPEHGVSAEAITCAKQGGIMASADAQGLGYSLYVPLGLHGETRGIMHLWRQSGPPFHADEEDLLGIYAAHVAVAMDSARLHETAARRVSELEELEQASRALSLGIDNESILSQALNAALRLTRAEACAVAIVDDDGIEVRVSPNFPDEDETLAGIRKRIAGAMAGMIGPIPQVQQILKETSGKGMAGKEFKSFLSVPLMKREGVFGVLGAFATEPEKLSVEDARALAALANTVAIALQHAGFFRRFRDMYRDTIKTLAEAVDAKDPYTLGHSNQVQMYVGALGRSLGLPDEEIERLEDAALLHDIGKISVPESILHKPGALTDEEFEVIKTHPARGAEMISGANHLRDLVPVVRHHHERFDGGGYPDGLQGKDIPLGARIVAVADTFDAIRSERSYRKPMPFDEAIQEISSCAGSQLDAQLVSLFLALPLKEMIVTPRMRVSHALATA